MFELVDEKHSVSSLIGWDRTALWRDGSITGRLETRTVPELRGRLDDRARRLLARPSRSLRRSLLGDQPEHDERERERRRRRASSKKAQQFQKECRNRLNSVLVRPATPRDAKPYFACSVATRARADAEPTATAVWKGARLPRPSRAGREPRRDDPARVEAGRGAGAAATGGRQLEDAHRGPP